MLDEGHIIKNGKTKVSGCEMVDIEDGHSTMETFKVKKKNARVKIYFPFDSNLNLVIAPLRKMRQDPTLI